VNVQKFAIANSNATIRWSIMGTQHIT